MQNPEQLDELKKSLGLEGKDIDIDEINRVLSMLTPREEKVIRMRYGIPKPPEPELTEEQEVIRKRIREIELKALRKIKAMKSEKD
jgi:DNA-directed RNA polymerase sigma subunit (sigma70/sigma32)